MSPGKSIIKKSKIDLFKKEAANDLSFIYYGDFSDQINDALIPLAEVVIGNSNVAMKIRKRAFYIFVECIQNVNRHHCKEKRAKTFPGEIFSIRQKQDRFNIAFGNVLDNSMVGDLKLKIDQLNQTTVEELDIEYKRILMDTVLSKIGGAGLGLIEVARKSGNKIQYNFDRLSDKKSYFSMETNVNDPGADQDLPDFNGLEDIRFYKNIFQNHRFGFFLKSSKNAWLTLKERNCLSLINFLDKPLFFKVKESESFTNSIIKTILKFQSFTGDKENGGLIMQLETTAKNKYFSLAWAGKEKEMQNCANLLSASLNHETYPPKLKQRPGGDNDLIELLSLLKGKSLEKTSLQLADDFSKTQMLILQVPLEL